MDGGSAAPVSPERAAAPHRRLRWVRRGAAILALLLVVEYLVVPQIAGSRQALGLLADVRPYWLVLGVALEAVSLASWSMLTRSMLPGVRPSFAWIFRTDLTSLGVSHVLPGGAAAATALRYRLLRDGGTPAEDTVVGLTVQSVGSSLVLISITETALIVSVPFAGVDRVYLVAAVVAAVVIGAAILGLAAAARSRSRGEATAARLARRAPKRFRTRVRAGLEAVFAQVFELLTDTRALRASALWAGANWLLDIASLWVFLAAYHHHVNPAELAVGYGLANILAVVPVSPGGLGVIEGVLIPSIVGFGTPRGIAVLGVLSWRLVQFWLPIPVAALCYLSLRTENWRSRHERRRAWTELSTVLAPGPAASASASAAAASSADSGDPTPPA